MGELGWYLKHRDLVHELDMPVTKKNNKCLMYCQNSVIYDTIFYDSSILLSIFLLAHLSKSSG